MAGLRSVGLDQLVAWLLVKTAHHKRRDLHGLQDPCRDLQASHRLSAFTLDDPAYAQRAAVLKLDAHRYRESNGLVVSGRERDEDKVFRGAETGQVGLFVDGRVNIGVHHRQLDVLVQRSGAETPGREEDEENSFHGLIVGHLKDEIQPLKLRNFQTAIGRSMIG